MVSELPDLEQTFTPELIKSLPLIYPSVKFERITFTQEALQLADKYISEKVVGKTSLEDCRHIHTYKSG